MRRTGQDHPPRMKGSFAMGYSVSHVATTVRSLDLREAARRARVLVFFGFLAWLFGVNPPGWQRVLLAFLALAAIAADVYLDDHKTRVPRPRFGTAA